MKFERNILSNAVRTALFVSAIGSLGVASVVSAQNTEVKQNTSVAQGTQQQPKEQPKKVQAIELQAVEVTGSHISRVDTETDNPVTTVTASQIEATGALTIGDLVAKLPSVTGSITTPAVDYSGVPGQTLVGLRGLGFNRTLVLVDGQRVLSKDLNAIPSAAIDHMEVLTSGAAATYGSDAIGGVINIILKKSGQGAQVSTSYGISSHDDAERKGASFTLGQSSDKGSFLMGVSALQLATVFGAARSISSQSRNLVKLPDGSYTQGPSRSSSSLRGNIRIDPSWAAKYGCSSTGALVLKESAYVRTDNPTTLSDYRCFTPVTDSYDYVGQQLIQTPQKRINFFFNGTYKLSDSINLNATILHGKTTSSYVFAPGGLSTGGYPGILISKDSYYNPFGVDFSRNGGGAFSIRTPQAGNRRVTYSYTNDQIITSLNGKIEIGDQAWTWDAGYDFGHLSQVQTLYNYQNATRVAAGLQASFKNADGVVQCGTPDSPIPLASCTPWDPFNPNSNSAEAFLPTSSDSTVANTTQIQRTYHADVNGGLINLPAGTMQLALGASYRDEYTNNVISPGLLLDPVSATCTLGGSQCTSHLQGGFNVKEAYGELFIPILQDLPFVSGLNMILGDRYSKYSDFGSTNNWKVGMEWRPISTLLLRGTVSTIFRAPNIGEVFGAPVNDAPFLGSDPCNHITVASPACVGVPLDGSFVNTSIANGTETGAQLSGAKAANFPIGPEQGKSFDLGAVYSPSFVPGLSLTLDAWRIYLKGTITSVGAQTVLNLCSAGNDVYCPLIRRTQGGPNAGQPITIVEPTTNLGRIDVKGTDLSGSYGLPATPFGQFTLNASVTYMDRFDIQTAPGAPGNTVFHAAGLMSAANGTLASACPGAVFYTCFYPRFRGRGTAGWQLGSWNAQWTMRYIGRFRMDGSPAGRHLEGIDDYGATVYNDATVSYNIEPIKLRISVGVDNLFNKQPPLLYNGRASTANTDPQDFDVLGRYYWARATINF